MKTTNKDNKKIKSRAKNCARAINRNRGKFSDRQTNWLSKASHCPESRFPNPLLTAQDQFLKSLSPLEHDSFFSNMLDADKRAEIWMKQSELGEDLVNRFSWAIPDARALRILQHFSPLVEVGCGANAYWCELMSRSGIDIIGFDVKPVSGGKIQAGTKRISADLETKVSRFPVRLGGPEILASDEIRRSNRNLFLCYPDEGEDNAEGGNLSTPLGAACLENYRGQYVIHVGELVGDTLSMEQAPWGRSSSPVFQERLAAEFHCLLKVGLTSWLFSRDTISVWKRSEICSIIFGADEDDAADEEVKYRHIPVEERLPSDIAAPCVKHLLQSTVEAKNENVSGQKPYEFDEYQCPW